MAFLRCGSMRFFRNREAYGAVRCGFQPYGAVRCYFMSWRSVRFSDIVKPAVRCGAVRCGAVRCGAVRCGAVRCGMVRCGYPHRTDRKNRTVKNPDVFIICQIVFLRYRREHPFLVFFFFFFPQISSFDSRSRAGEATLLPPPVYHDNFINCFFRAGTVRNSGGVMLSYLLYS